MFAQPGDLAFKKGQVITIIKKSESTDAWYVLSSTVQYSPDNLRCRWTGQLDGREGIFPANFVEVA